MQKNYTPDPQPNQLFTSPAFQIYPADWLSDANFLAMSNAAAGLLFRLVLLAWRNGPLPRDASKIARLTGVDQSDVERLIDEIGPMAQPSDDGATLTFPAIETQRKIQLQHRAERSKAGRKGARSKWQKSAKPTQGQQDSAGDSGDGSAIVLPMAKHSSSSSSSSSSSKGESPADYDVQAVAEIRAAVEDAYPGHSTNFRTVRELTDLTLRLNATSDDIQRFPEWLQKNHPKKANTPLAFKDLFPESLKKVPAATSRPAVSQMPDWYAEIYAKSTAVR